MWLQVDNDAREFRSAALAEPNNGNIQEIRKVMRPYSDLWFVKP